MLNCSSISAWSLRRSFCMGLFASSRASEKEVEMSHRLPGSVSVVAVGVAVLLLIPIRGAAQAQPAANATPGKGTRPAKSWAVPRTQDGQPDLQGIWSNATLTPLERPRELAGKQFFTEKEAAEYEKRVLEHNNADRRDSQNAEAD